jgi:hypothetical protein
MALLAIDFDGVIHDHLAPPLEGKVLGPPIEGARNSICELRNERRHKIIIYSVKPPDIIEDWLNFFEIPFDRITNMKPTADIYIDDKGLRFHSWPLTMAALEYNLPVDGGGKRIK